jgi:hypothetical protein
MEETYVETDRWRRIEVLEPPAMQALDGTLRNWGDIANEYRWDTLLLGNGMSINVWEPFGYRVLFNKAKADSLAPAERELSTAGSRRSG